MWTTFLLAFSLMVVALYVPGFMMLRALKLSRIGAVCCAPLITVALYAVLAIAYQKFGVFASFVSLICPVAAVGVLMLSLTYLGQRVAVSPRGRATCGKHGIKAADGSRSCGKAGISVDADAVEWLMLIAYVLVGLTAATLIFVKNLDGPSSFMQEYDNWYHLGAVRSFIETGNYSSLSPSIYADWRAQGLTEPYETISGFYPSAWHGIVAMVVSLLGSTVTLGVNALNAMIVGVVYPVGVFYLLRTLFGPNRSVRWLGSIGAVAFSAFPWCYVEYGPLYPNLLSSALLPMCISCFIEVFADGSPSRERIRSGGIFIVGSMAVALAQPNGIFTAAIILAPYCVYQAGRIASRAWKGRVVVAVQVVVALSIFAIWIVCYRLPAFREIVNFNWASYESFHQAVASALLLGVGMESIQPLLALCVLIGFTWALTRREYRWIAVSYLLVFVSYCIATSFEGYLKHILTGFWYTDPRRLAANMAIAGLPLAVIGMSRLFGWLKRIFLAFAAHPGEMSAKPTKLAGVLSLITVLVLVFYPNFEMRGIVKVTTAFGGLADHIAAQNSQSRNNILNPEERAFAEKAFAITGNNDPIINTPNDGSCFLYGIDDMNMMYRFFYVQDPSKETEASRLIRTELNQVATDASVQEAVKSYGVRYVLVLDQGEDKNQPRRFVGNYDPAQWRGILSITDDTPGFKTVLSEGDMRLYEIVV